VQEIGDSLDDQKRVVSYDLKDLAHRDNYAHMIISTEFSPLDVATNNKGDAA